MKTFLLKITNGSYKGKQLRLLKSGLKLGRASDCDVIFKDDPGCSRHHAEIQKHEDSFLIQSLNPKNPVLVNKKAIESQVLKPGDSIQIGSSQMIFVEQDSAQAFIASRPSSINRQKKNFLSPPRLILILLLLGGAFLYFSEDSNEQKEVKKLDLRTEEDILNEVEEIKEQNEEDLKNLTLEFKQEESRTAFISGFRDYRKGYFVRAIRMFKHCSMLDKGNELCHRYELKSGVQIEKLIQKKIRLGNAYKANKQYKACVAVFKSVELMVQDTNRAVYKDAKSKRLSCSLHLRNKI